MGSRGSMPSSPSYRPGRRGRVKGRGWGQKFQPKAVPHTSSAARSEPGRKSSGFSPPGPPKLFVSCPLHPGSQPSSRGSVRSHVSMQPRLEGWAGIWSHMEDETQPVAGRDSRGSVLFVLGGWMTTATRVSAHKAESYLAPRPSHLDTRCKGRTCPLLFCQPLAALVK